MKPIAKTAIQTNSAVGLHVVWAGTQPSIERWRSMRRSGRLAGAATTDAVTNAVATVGNDLAIDPARASTRRADQPAQAIAATLVAAATWIDHPPRPHCSQTWSRTHKASLVQAVA